MQHCKATDLKIDTFSMWRVNENALIEKLSDFVFILKYVLHFVFPLSKSNLKEYACTDVPASVGDNSRAVF